MFVNNSFAVYFCFKNCIALYVRSGSGIRPRFFYYKEIYIYPQQGLYFRAGSGIKTNCFLFLNVVENLDFPQKCS